MVRSSTTENLATLSLHQPRGPKVRPRGKMKGGGKKSYRRSGNAILFTWHASFPQNVYDPCITTEDFLETQRGAILKGATIAPQNCRVETTAFGNNIQEEVEGELRGQQRSSKGLWFLLDLKKKKCKDQD